jgi:hypothetical protein
MDTKLKIEGVNFTRTICALGIIFYHFFEHRPRNIRYLLHMPTEHGER